MSWSEIKEISKFNFVHVGNHSHSHVILLIKVMMKLKRYKNLL